MKKVLVAVMVVAVSMMFAVAVQAGDEVKVESTTKITDQGSTTKMKESTPTTKDTVKMKENKSGEVTDANVKTKFEGGVATSKGTLVREQVKFHSFNQDNDTISIIQTDGKVVTRPAKFDHTHRDYILKTYKKNDTITATYDTNLGGAVVATELAK